MGVESISSEEFDAKIIKAVGGIYYVDAPSGVYAGEPLRCAARGIFRREGVSPCAGDNVRVCIQQGAEPIITQIYERRNYLVRPPLANLDGVVFVNSCVEPSPNRFILDKLTAIFDRAGIEPMIVFTKTDLCDAGGLPEIYSAIGIKTCTVDNTTGEGAGAVREFIAGKTAAFIGNSGVGKSSLLNVLFPELGLETAHISKKLGRGRHTTRQVEMYKLLGGYIADTPGFSTVDTERYCRIPKEELDGAFREFAQFKEKCAFTDCAHIKEKGCAVRAAVERGEIAQSRYDSYLRMYEESSKINSWE